MFCGAPGAPAGALELAFEVQLAGVVVDTLDGGRAPAPAPGDGFGVNIRGGAGDGAGVGRVGGAGFSWESDDAPARGGKASFGGADADI